MKTLKKFNEATYKKDFKELEDLKVLLIEKIDLLKQLDVKDLTELEEYILKSTGFKNVQMSATAIGIEKEYNRILEINKLLQDKISLNDLNKDYSFKKAFLDKLKTKHSTFYTSAELDTLNRLQQVLTSYNNLTIEERGQLAININGMMINPFSYLLR